MDNNILITFLRKHPLISVSIGMVLVYTPVVVLIRPAFFEWLDLAHTGEIGDTIGGITAPIIGLLGIVVVFLSFEEQRKANEIQQQANDRLRIDHDLQFIQALYAEWKEEMPEVKEKAPKTAIDSTIDVLSTISDWPATNYDERPFTFLEHLHAFLISQRILLKKIRTSQLSENEKIAYLSKITYYYHSHLRPIVVSLLRDAEQIVDKTNTEPNNNRFGEFIATISAIDIETSPHPTL